tara:strand:- start:87 stop:350 length:264 start_codon:yes stop_codon:yes gene_type:complete
MIKVSMYQRRPRLAENFETLLEDLQLRHPWCEKANNDYYMRNVRESVCSLHDIPKNNIDVTSAEAFVRSLTEIGEAEIISLNAEPIV